MTLPQAINYYSSVAMDKNGSNQNVSGTNFTAVSAGRVLWDLNDDFDSGTGFFQTPYNGVYFNDLQLRVDSFVNVAAVELALYKVGSPDDYWFIIDYKTLNGASTLQLSGATHFDMYMGDQFYVAIKLYSAGVPLVTPSARIVGDDDYTAWGFTFVRGL